MSQHIVKIPINNFTSVESAIVKINQSVEGKNLAGIFINRLSLMRSEIEILVEEPQTTSHPVIIERPSKFKQGASSQYYCVYKKGNKWTYKFVNKKLNPKPFLGTLYETERDAALAYDERRYSVEGDLSKLNFPENYIKKVVK